jgi:hypothetical protein
MSLFMDCPAAPALALHCPNATAKEAAAAAVRRGDIVLHALPHNPQLELMDAGLLVASVEMSQAVATALGQPRPRVASVRDVTGVTRAAVPVLAAAGVEAISIGANSLSAPADLPRAFIWRDEASDSEIFGLYHGLGYGGITKGDCATLNNGDSGGSSPSRAGLDLVLAHNGTAVAYAWNEDNTGPHTPAAARANLATLRQEFPNATVVCAGLDAALPALRAARAAGTLPVVTKEVGDSWIWGVPSDPWKLSAFRCLGRLRNASSSTPAAQTPEWREFSRCVNTSDNFATRRSSHHPL